MVEVLKKNNHVIYCDFDHYFINKFYTFTTGEPPLSCAAYSKSHTATRDRQSRPLPCAIYRAHGKGFAVCHSRPTQNKVASQE